jgi:predicted phosphodiesterase
MRYLILTDIHANIDALMAVKDSFDKVIVLGDLVDYGAAPGEVIDWVRERRPMAVSGNHDFAMATGADCRSSPISYALSVATRKHFRPRLTADQNAFLASLPKQAIASTGSRLIHLVHATPRDPLFEYLSGDAPEDTWREAIGPLTESEGLLLVGHTHKPFMRQVGRLQVVNPGSLGMPVDGDPRGCYAIWEDGRIELKRVEYDIDSAVKRLYDSGLPPETAQGMERVLRKAGR